MPSCYQFLMAIALKQFLPAFALAVAGIQVFMSQRDRSRLELSRFAADAFACC